MATIIDTKYTISINRDMVLECIPLLSQNMLPRPITNHPIDLGMVRLLMKVSIWDTRCIKEVIMIRTIGAYTGMVGTATNFWKYPPSCCCLMPHVASGLKMKPSK